MHRVAKRLVLVGVAILLVVGSCAVVEGRMSRRAVDERCAGLVPTRPVLKLAPHRPVSGGQSVHVDQVTRRTQSCTLTSSGPEKNDAHQEYKVFFRGSFGVRSHGAKQEPRLQLPYPDGRLLASDDGRPWDAAQPIGGGVAGYLSRDYAVAELPCRGSTFDTVWASVQLTYPQRPDQDAERDALAATVVGMLGNLAGHLGCARRVPEAPTGIPAPAKGAEPVADATGTCAWFRASGLSRDPKVAELAVSQRTDRLVWTERCDLVLGKDRTATLGAPDDVWSDGSRTRAEWWASLQSRFGDYAERVHLSPTNYPARWTHAEPGAAGVVGGTSWWASSTCGGEPAVHTLTLKTGYAKVAARAYERVFRAYVDDVTERRGCTGVRFPPHSTFTR